MREVCWPLARASDAHSQEAVEPDYLQHSKKKSRFRPALWTAMQALLVSPARQQQQSAGAAARGTTATATAATRHDTNGNRIELNQQPTTGSHRVHTAWQDKSLQSSPFVSTRQTSAGTNEYPRNSGCSETKCQLRERCKTTNVCSLAGASLAGACAEGRSTKRPPKCPSPRNYRTATGAEAAASRVRFDKVNRPSREPDASSLFPRFYRDSTQS